MMTRAKAIEKMKDMLTRQLSRCDDPLYHIYDQMVKAKVDMPDVDSMFEDLTINVSDRTWWDILESLGGDPVEVLSAESVEHIRRTRDIKSVMSTLDSEEIISPDDFVAYIIEGEYVDDYNELARAFGLPVDDDMAYVLEPSMVDMTCGLCGKVETRPEYNIGQWYTETYLGKLYIGAACAECANNICRMPTDRDTSRLEVDLSKVDLRSDRYKPLRTKLEHMIQG